MNVVQKIIQGIQELPESEQAEVLNFVEYLKTRGAEEENKDWSDLSLSSAMRGTENEESPYSLKDLKESF
jgi:hypothetical protein